MATRERAVRKASAGAAERRAGRRPAERERRPEAEAPRVLEEISVEELAIDGICGVY